MRINKPVSDAKAGVVFFCHGSRDPAWRLPFEQILASFSRDCPDVPAALGFLELMTPDMHDAVAKVVAQGVVQLRIVPLFLAPGRHTGRDLNNLIAQFEQRWPDVQFDAAPSLLELPVIRAAIVRFAVGNPLADQRD